MFLCAKEPKMSRETAGKYVKRSKTLVNKRYKITNTVDDLLEFGLTQF